jgi:hypothetical protein
MKFLKTFLEWLEASVNRYEERRFQSHFENAKDIVDVERIMRKLQYRNPGAFL